MHAPLGGLGQSVPPSRRVPGATHGGGTAAAPTPGTLVAVAVKWTLPPGRNPYIAEPWPVMRVGRVTHFSAANDVATVKWCTNAGCDGGDASDVQLDPVRCVGRIADASGSLPARHWGRHVGPDLEGGAVVRDLVAKVPVRSNEGAHIAKFRAVFVGVSPEHAMNLTVGEIRSRWPDQCERLLRDFHARQLPSAHFEDACAAGRGDTRIAVGGLPDAALRTLLAARGLGPGGARDALLCRLRPPAPSAPMGHCDFSLPSPPQLRSLLVALVYGPPFCALSWGK
eukprot:g609.t1